MTLHDRYYRLAAFCVRRPLLVLIATLVPCALALVLSSTRLQLKTSNLDLVDPTLPEVKGFLDFAEEFGTPNMLVVVLEGKDAPALRAAVDRVGPLLRTVPGVRGVFDRVPLDAARLQAAGVDPYIASRDQGLFMIFVQPADAHSSADTIGPMIDGVRAVLRDAALEHTGVRAGLTGLPQYAIDDRDVLKHDISLLSGLSFFLIALLFVASFASLRRPILAMVPLVLSTVLTMGVVALVPGHLTLLSAFFASILFGMGVDYGIHIINRIEELLAAGVPEREAIPRSIGFLATDLTTGSATTAFAFFAMLFSGFRGFAELGFIAGISILTCLVLMLTLLPALLSLFPARHPRARRARTPWIGRALASMQSPWVTLAVGAGAVGLACMGSPGFDGNYLNLEPKHSEAVRLEREMVARADVSPQFAVFVTDSKARAAALADRLLDDQTVGEVRSIADLEMLAPVDGERAAWPEDFLARFRSPRGNYAVYAYPAGNVWEPDVQAAFISHMRAFDPHVVGMPMLGKFMTDLSNHALTVTAAIASVVMVVCVFIDFRSILLTLIAVLPTLLSIAALHGAMTLLGIPYNPLNVMALPVILGVSEDNGVHMVHRFLAEKGDLRATLTGSGRSVVMTSLTTIAGFGTLAFTSHRGLASFAIVLSLGVGMSLVLSVLVLPNLLRFLAPRLLRAAGGKHD